MDAPETIEPRPGARWRALLVVALLGLAGGASTGLLPTLMRTLQDAPPCEQRTWVQAIVAAQALLLLVGPALLAAMAMRALRAGAWPPSDAWVLRRTRVWRGARMRRGAWVCVALAAGLAAAIVVLSWRLATALAAALPACTA